MIQFECPHCGRRIRAAVDAAGRSGRCKQCGKVITAPTPDGTAPILLAGPGEDLPQASLVAELAGRLQAKTPATVVMGMINAVTNSFAKARQRCENIAEFRRALMSAVEDGSISDAELQELKTLYATLGLTQDDISQIRVLVFAKGVEAATAQNSLTAEEYAEFGKLQTFLGIPDSQVVNSRRQLARLRLITEIQGGNLPCRPASRAPNVILQKKETLHWVESASLLEERVVSRRYVGGSSGFSFRIMKGVTYRCGQSRGEYVTDKAVVPVSYGELVITNRRVIFRGDKKSFNLRLDKLLETGIYTNAVRLTGQNGTPRTVLLGDPDNIELVAAVLSAAINRFVA